MVLYLSAESEKHLGYTPDTLIVENGNKCFTYDIQGTTDYELEDLYTRTKGILLKRHDDIDDYVEMNEEEEKELHELLNDKNTKVIIAIYPVPQCEDSEELDNDRLINCQGTLYMGDHKNDFTFATEFYGI